MAKLEHEYQAYIRTTPDRLWEAITDPAQTRLYFYGLAVTSDWKPGSSLKHVLPDGKSTTIEGKVLEIEPGRKLVHTFATTGVADAPSRVTWEIEPMGPVTLLTVTHDEFDGETQTYRTVARGWNPVVSGLKTLLETGTPLEIPAPAQATSGSAS
jgi:uncharacterized protein YndB with AHSA1/START domain